MSQPEVLAQVERWADELIDRSRKNRLLYFRHTRSTSLEFAQDAAQVEAGLRQRPGWRFFLPPPPPEDEHQPYHPGQARVDQLVVDMQPPRYGPQIERGLTGLAREARAKFLDTGLWVLHLGLGLLRWTDVDNQPVRTPLLLVPVRLDQHGPAKDWRLTRSEDGEPALNPALGVKLEKDFDISLPSLDELDEPDLAHVLSAVTKAVTDPAWRIEDRAVLTKFMFQKEVIYQDLRRNAATVAAHPLVRLLAEGPTSDVAPDLAFEPEEEEGLDDRHPPEELACVLDADVTQRQALVAARQGRSFVLDGPPGTGKSQTITNMIAQLLQDGKTVLFVSEKAAALDVVLNRLDEHQLDPFVLTLHSHKATRKEVAQELGRALRDRPKARERFDPNRQARLLQSRERLSDYAVAMNRVRPPLGRSLHDAVGRVAQLADLPDTPVPAVDTRELDASGLAELRDQASQLGRSWDPVERGSDFVWRDLGDPRGGAVRQSDLRRRVEAGRVTLDQLRIRMASICEDLVLPEPSSPQEAGDLRNLLEALERRPPVGPEWLSTTAPETLDEDIELLIRSLREREEIAARLEATTARWRDLAVSTRSSFDQMDQQVAQMQPAMTGYGSADASALRAMTDVVRQALDVTSRLTGPLQILAEAFEARSTLTVDLATRLVALGQLVGHPTAPEAGWLSPAHRPAADAAHQVLGRLLADYRTRRDHLASLFTTRALDFDLQGLHTRFDHVHTGVAKLGGNYRADKRMLAAGATGGKVSKAVLERLGEAVEWQAVAHRLANAEAHHAALLGPHYWPSRDGADLTRLGEAFVVADRALAFATTDVPHEALVRHLARGTVPDPALLASVAEAAEALARWRALPLASTLGVPAADLHSLSLDQLVAWLPAVGLVLDNLTTTAGTVDQLVGHHLTVEEARSFARQRAEHATAETTVASLVERTAGPLGRLDEDLDADRIRDAAAWVTEVRAYLPQPLPGRSAAAVLATTLAPEPLGDDVTRWDKAVSELLGAFRAPYADDLTRDLASSFADAHELLDHLERTVQDVDVWESYSQAGRELAEAGWGAVVDACVEQRVHADQVVDLVERAVLQRWVAQVMDGDAALEPRRTADRDALVEEFRRLDRELIADAAARVINTCAQRRPRSVVGPAGIIQQQAELSRRHKPVRQLLDEAGEAALKLKPCFMMSPLSVSQFLPPGFRFDVVIFDEASQVREAEAIGCIYRAEQLIVAGDPKQLPPTTFFEREDEDDEDTDDQHLDFESVLDRGKAQGVPSVPLGWHYRSRAESLITFSNRSFYDGRLHTFPEARFDAADLGVELIRVDGIYDRGGTRDNLIEADQVVERVLHHRRLHPDLTIGVVALSGAQQLAVEEAIERRSADEPELAHLVSDDRLHGFFVKNLENVQGDERDLIILSVGYGPDELGKLHSNFGPMSRDGGERRLNVAITRARRRVEVVASFGPGDVSTENPTTRHLLRYLDYAERGLAALAVDTEEPEQLPESPVEESVISAVRQLGHDCTPQVGVHGYRIDIGVHHPSEPGRYVLGIECDGYAYHSSKVARDRDRLRQEVLEGLGWSIHRIWGTAWHNDRSGEIGRLKEAIAHTLDGRRRRNTPPPTPRPLEVEVEEHDFDDHPDWARPYEEPTVSHRRTGLDPTDPSAWPDLLRQHREIVDRYGPIHRDQVRDALRRAWGLQRAGARIRETFDQAASALVARGELRYEDGFLARPGAEVRVRVPTDGATEPRKVGHVPPAELDLAITLLLRDAGTTPYQSLRQAVARLLGWRRVGIDIELAFDRAVHRLRGQEVIEGDDPVRLTD